MKLRTGLVAIVTAALLAQAATAEPSKKVEDDSADAVVLVAVLIGLAIVAGGGVIPADAGAEVPANP